ncbi:GNAT family N-acetyltransferase [Bordetella genomosp. 5]|uniref:GNAT family N-acetyltransferase n=1 Tax=Bordetella genomosp. 5 TaxID=1395608 RepID=A0A261TP11_9BORD|nr:GNAT family protein [Bordetella genomosp. 5]OZI50363.1 GNAT family N-acetyltransferase [Bordetella genomosp. 5]
MQLRAFDPADFDALASWFDSQRAVSQWGGSHVRHPLTAAQFEVMLAEGRGTRPQRQCWTAWHEDRAVGHGQIAYDWQDGNARLGRIVIAPQARGQGLARPMLRQLIDLAFDIPDIQRVELNVYMFNEVAIHTYKTLGFAFEGVRRSSTRVDDERWDTGMMGLLRHEWRPPA